jgi:hypothetical protein
MRDVHPRLKHQTERLLMRHDPRYKRRVVDRPFGVFPDRKRPKDGRRGDIERAAKVTVDISHAHSRPSSMSIIRRVDHVDVETGKTIERETDLPESEVRSDACSPPKSKGEGFQIVVDLTVGAYPSLWVKPFGVGEHVGVARNAPTTRGPSLAIISFWMWLTNGFRTRLLQQECNNRSASLPLTRHLRRIRG